MPDKLTLSVEEAAALSGIGRDRLYQLAKRNDFPSIRLGRSIRIPRKGLEEWIEREAMSGKTVVL
ncbi:MAG: helix-turn-helix domain-containing protein [Intestinimonas sp.]|jgi:excisionase family DNA binding protein|nr:helix-turn-helix domain-containing protein [Intestinimonas sp.]